MKSLTKIILFLSSIFILTSAASFANPENTTSTNKIQDTEKAAKYFEDEMNFVAGPYSVKLAIANKKDIVIVDVRDAKDYAKGHIPGAINLPIGDYKGFEGEETEFKGLRKDTINYVYCYTLFCNASQKACKKFASLGYPVKEIKGGFKTWQEHNFPVEK